MLKNNNSIVFVCLLLVAAFLPVYLALSHQSIPYLLDFTNALGFTVGMPVLWRYTPGALFAIRQVLFHRQPLSKGPLLVLGIALTWAAMVMRTAIIWRWRYLGEPDLGLDNAGMALAAMLMVPGGACHLLASAMPTDNVQIPRLGASLLTGGLVSGVFLGAAIAYLRWLQ